MSEVIGTEELMLIPGKPYQIRSADGRWVQAVGPMQPVELVRSPSSITVWQVVEIATTGRIALRSPRGWYASVPKEGADGPVIEDPDNGTNWERKHITGELYTLNYRAEQFWTRNRNSDEIMLHPKQENTGNQDWVFIEIARTTSKQ